MRSLSCQLTFILFLMAEYTSSTQSQRDNAIIMYYVLHHELSRTSSGAIAKGLGKILDSGGIIEYFCQAISSGKHNCRLNIIVDTFFCDG